MANLDTRNKRGSVLMLDYAFGRIWPNPSGSLASQGQRQQMAYLYAGVLTAIIVSYFNGFTTQIRLTGVGQ